MSGQHARAPDAALDALAHAPADRPVALLHSGRFHPRWAQRSVLARPVAWFRHTADGRSELAADPDASMPDVALSGRPFRDLRALLNHPGLPGRWVGYLSYDLGRVIERGKLDPPPRSDWPLIELGYCPAVEAFPPPDRAGASAAERGPAPHAALEADFTRPAYEAAVRRVIDYIAAGDAFQVNLAQRFATAWRGRPRDLFARLAAVSPAWYGAYVEMPAAATEPPPGAGPARALLSTSPELFLEVRGRRVITRPIKGTRPASDPRDPASGVDELRASEKDKAELNMIVDLMRNDLGRVCAYGSVKVDEPRTIESHPTVHHGVATISGTLHERFDVVDLLRATLPGGSITGAPKVRAMQIIDELEPVPRGPYCGCIGWITSDACQLNIAIRTMALTRSDVREAGRVPGPPAYAVSFHVGGGIVADSDPAAEYDETLAKAQAMLRALAAAT